MIPLRRLTFGSMPLLLAIAVVPNPARAAHMRVCEARHYGARADGQTNDARALQAAIDDCAGKGGGVVRLRGGTFLSGPVILRSHITLDVEKGATLLGSPRHDDYPLMTVFRAPGRQSLISADHAEHIVITGGGTIDGAGESWWAEVRHQKQAGVVGAVVFRPRLVVFDHCRHVLIDHVTIQNSPSWQVVPYYSDDVTLRDARILAPPDSPNTDGIDPFSSSHVTIERMLIDDGDDNVAIKSGLPNSPGPDSPSTDIVVRNCTFLHGHGMSIGSEASGGVSNVRVSDVRFRGTDNGVRVKSNRDRGANIGDLYYSNLTMENVRTPLLITEYYPRIPEQDTAQAVTRFTPHFHDIHISNLTATGARQDGIVAGLPESPITTLYLDHVHLQGKTGLRISNARVTAHDLTVEAAVPPKITVLAHAQLVRR